MRQGLLSLPTLVAAALAWAGPASADSTADYRLEARLDPTRHRVTAHGTVRLTNGSARPIDRLTFHLYLNAFENDDTLWLRESEGALRGAQLSAYGWIDVTRLWAQGQDLLAQARRDETLLHVPLPRPVQPGGVVDVEVAFVEQLPSAFARTGFARSFHMVAQWFPKLARLSSDGLWAARPYHATHEYYADFGSYSVTIDVPAGTIVGATGERVSERRATGRQIVAYRADNVHDFAWAASPHFLERFARVGDVRVRFLYYPGQEEQVSRQIEAVSAALPRFERMLGPYPYPVLTLVCPPEDALGAGGMEYPTLITTAALPFAGKFQRFTEEVAIHELGHQWFYGLLASNEPDEAWLDEGLNTYVTGRIMDELYGTRTSTLRLWGLKLGYGTLSRIARASAETREPIAQRSADFASVSSYGSHVYYGTDLLLRTLAGRVGPPRLDAALARYARRHRFTHPTGADLLQALDDELGPEVLEDLVVPVLRQAATFDVAVRSITTGPVVNPAGYVRRDGRRVRVDAPERAPGLFRTVVLLTRDGAVRLPVDVEVTFVGGTRRRYRWDGHGHHHRLELTADAPATGASADPDLLYPLDRDLTNNARSVGGPSFGTARLWTRLLYAAQTALQVLGP